MARGLEDYYILNMRKTKEKLKQSVGQDSLIVQAISSIEELDKLINIMAKRLREWYELYNPEFSKGTKDNIVFVMQIAAKKDKKSSSSFGAELTAKDLSQIYALAESAQKLISLRKQYEGYLALVMKGYCPNLLAIAGTTLAAKLIAHCGSLKKLSEITASTIQLLGAEKALFRHIKTGAKSPKHGIILQHKLVQKAAKKGKMARALADKLAIAAKVDYFRGELIAGKLNKELEEKFNSLK